MPEIVPPRMFLSVIIPAINESESIPRAVQSAWNAQADEVLVVDGGSHDDTVERGAACGARVLRSTRGRAAQQNLGAREARGEVLLFLHADNWLCPEAGTQIRAALARPRVGCGAFQQRIAAPEAIYRWVERGNAWRVRWRGIPYGDQGIFLRKTLFDDVGGFPSLPLMEDLVLMRRVRRRSWPVLLPGPLHVDPRRWRRHGVARQTLRNWSLVAAYQLGVSPARLARQYRPHDDSPTRPNSPADGRGEERKVEAR